MATSSLLIRVFGRVANGITVEPDFGLAVEYESSLSMF
jgi:hypothetical protein